VVSLLLAIDREGVIAHEITKGSFNQHSFSRFIGRLPKHKTVLLDNVSLHKTAIVKRACEEQGIQLRFTPPYCPWFNPTEYAFSLSKRDFRQRRGLRAEGAPHFEDDIRASLETITADKCVNFYEHALKLVQSTFQETP
jgi:transposase InsO family protein